LSVPLVILAIAASAIVTSRLVRVIIRRVIRRLAKRSLQPTPGGPGSSAGLWRVRSGRIDGETGEISEQRRRQRIDAASRMVSHLASLVIWVVAVIVAFHLLHIDPAFFLSSAGFIGAGLAIGGQHKVNDYLTGLTVHFEDRYGVGDEIVADVGWNEVVQGIVDHVGLFSTRVRDHRSTLHFPNHALTSIRNLSQEAAASTLRLRVPSGSGADDAAMLLRGLAGTEGLTDVIFLGDVAARCDATGEVELDVWTSRVLDDRQRDQLVGRAERALFDAAEG
jgi:small-conductance mechanosensitive channel